jgi:hypothetical protein
VPATLRNLLADRALGVRPRLGDNKQTKNHTMGAHNEQAQNTK